MGKCKAYLEVLAALGLFLLPAAGCQNLFSAVPGQSISDIDDRDIASRVKSELLADPELSALNINVESRKGIVSLKGFVESEEELRKAVEKARAVKGVKQVVAKLLVD